MPRGKISSILSIDGKQWRVKIRLVELNAPIRGIENKGAYVIACQDGISRSQQGAIKPIRSTLVEGVLDLDGVDADELAFGAAEGAVLDTIGVKKVAEPALPVGDGFAVDAVVDPPAVHLVAP